MIIDERAQAEELLKNKSSIFTSDLFGNIRLLSRYWNDIGMNKSQILNNIDELFEHRSRRVKDMYNKIALQDKIERTVNKIIKQNSKLILIDEIIFTKSEINTILSLNKPQLRRLAFVILFHAKINKASFGKSQIWLNDDIGKYSEQAGIKQSQKYKYQLFGELYRKKLIYTKINPKRMTYRIDYIDDIGDIVFSIKKIHDDKELIFYYYKYIENDSKISNCEYCGRLIRKNVHNKKYCKKCKKEIDKSKSKEIMKNKRKTKKLSGE